jgi:hypothetical protein
MDWTKNRPCGSLALLAGSWRLRRSGKREDGMYQIKRATMRPPGKLNPVLGNNRGNSLLNKDPISNSGISSAQRKLPG